MVTIFLSIAIGNEPLPTTMALILRRVLQQVAVQLLDMVFGERNVLPVRKDSIHRLGVTGNFLFVPRSEVLHIKTGEQRLYLRQSAANADI